MFFIFSIAHVHVCSCVFWSVMWWFSLTAEKWVSSWFFLSPKDQIAAVSVNAELYLVGESFLLLLFSYFMESFSDHFSEWFILRMLLPTMHSVLGLFSPAYLEKHTICFGQLVWCIVGCEQHAILNCFFPNSGTAVKGYSFSPLYM